MCDAVDGEGFPTIGVAFAQRACGVMLILEFPPERRGVAARREPWPAGQGYRPLQVVEARCFLKIRTFRDVDG